MAAHVHQAPFHTSQWRMNRTDQTAQVMVDSLTHQAYIPPISAARWPS